MSVLNLNPPWYAVPAVTLQRKRPQRTCLPAGRHGGPRRTLRECLVVENIALSYLVLTAVLNDGTSLVQLHGTLCDRGFFQRLVLAPLGEY